MHIFLVLRAKQNVAYWQIRSHNLNKDNYLLLTKDQLKTTSFLLALESCLTWLLERSPPGIDVCFLVQKRIYLHCIETYESRDKYAQGVWRLLNELAQEHQIYFATNSKYDHHRQLNLGNKSALGPNQGQVSTLPYWSNIDWMIRHWNFEWEQYDEASEDQMFYQII